MSQCIVNRIEYHLVMSFPSCGCFGNCVYDTMLLHVSLHSWQIRASLSLFSTQFALLDQRRAKKNKEAKMVSKKKKKKKKKKSAKKTVFITSFRCWTHALSWLTHALFQLACCASVVMITVLQYRLYDMYSLCMLLTYLPIPLTSRLFVSW